MKKYILSVLFAFGTVVSYSDTIKDNLVPLDNVKADKWWLSSWKEGYQYEHEVTYQLFCDVKLDYKKQESGFWSWFENTSKSAVALALNKGGIVNGYFSGAGRFQTEVLSSEPELTLFRYYTDVASDRRMQLNIADLPYVSSTYDFIMKKSGVKKTIRYGLHALNCLFVEPIVDPFKLDKVAVFLGDAAQKKVEEYIKENKIIRTKDGFEIPSDSPLFKEYVKENVETVSKIDEIDAVAVLLTKEFNLSSYIIRANSKTGHLSGLKQLKDGNFVIDFIKNKRVNAKKSQKFLDTNIKDLPEASNLAKAVLQREVFAINKEIFAEEKRNKGDVWVVDADFLNSFLHPDLRGRITGLVVLKYEENITYKAKNGDKYKARVISIVDKGVVNGITRRTDFKYLENDFEATWNKASSGSLFIDMETGLLRNAELDIRAFSASALPENALTSGFMAVGDATLKISFNCNEASTK